MTVERGPDDLEARCIATGHWLIEGVRVCRIAGARWKWELNWTLTPAYARTLREAREAIAEAMNHGRW